jgi:hypothetical protein
MDTDEHGWSFFEGGIGPRKERKDTEDRQNTKVGGEKGSLKR